jgi:thiol-disulfide isomerase/thioredoxin
MDIAQSLAPREKDRNIMGSRRRSSVRVFGLIALAVTSLPGGFVPSLLAQTKDARASAPAGTWVGTAEYNHRQVPFKLEISGTGDQLQGALINGEEKSPTSSGSYSDGHLLLLFDYYADTLDATLKDGVLTGTFSGRSRSIPLTARLDTAPLPASANPPDIAGTREVAVKSPKGEAAWDLHVRQSGAEVDAFIQRIDGDTGDLYGTWRNGQFAVSHFTAAGPSYFVLRPQPDATLQIVTFSQGSTQELTARRPQAARSAGLAGPDDPLHHTTLKDPNQALTFSFPDLNGKVVSSADPAFKGKVVIVSIGGSWCPNCHDEAPLLEELYCKYHNRGLEVVELSFEEEEQLGNPSRLKAVIRRYGITFPVLLAGTPEQLNEKLPQAIGLNCWPTTFFIGRDGLVKTIYAGYSGPATGKDHADLRAEVNALVQRLLSGDERASIGIPAPN